MKIIQLFKIYWPDNGGGIAMTMKNIAECLCEYEHRVIVCQGRPGRKTVKKNVKGVRVIRCCQLFTIASVPVSIRFLLEVKKEINKTDIVICHYPYPMSDLAVLLGWCSGKLIVWWHCDLEHSYMFLYRPLIRYTLKKADKILVSSEGNLESSVLLQRFRRKCEIIPFCVNEEYRIKGLQYAKKQEAVWKSCCNVTILFIGRLVWYKGCDILLRAFASIKSSRTLRLVIVGKGPLEKKLKLLAKELELTNVCFTGRITEHEKMAKIKECDFLVLPSISKSEAFALVQIEAMAFGKPVINTNLPGGVPYVSVNGVTGITVEPGNVFQLADAMRTLAEDEELRRTYGRRALERVNKHYTKAVMQERYKKLLKQISDKS